MKFRTFLILLVVLMPAIAGAQTAPPATEAALRARITQLETEVAGLHRDYALMLKTAQQALTSVAPTSRPVSQVTAAPSVVSAATAAEMHASGLDDAGATIRAECAAKWRTDYSMQAFCLKEQGAALQRIVDRLPSLQADEQRIAFLQCFQKWRKNYEMVDFCIGEQLKALATLR